MDGGKTEAFFENAGMLREEMDIIPLMYGSLGLQYLTGCDLSADDIDILIPGAFITKRWTEFKRILEKNGYALIDEHEHTFEKDGVHYAYAQIEELETFAGIRVDEINKARKGNVDFMLLSLKQYLSVYTASSKDGYRMNVKEKRDMDKIALIHRKLHPKMKEDKHMKPTYIVKRVAAPDWEQIKAVELTHQPWLEPNDVQAYAQLCHDGKKLYVRMTAKERDIRATLTDPLSMVCNDSCLEFFFAPDCGMRYFNFEWNPLGTLYLGFGGARETRVRQLVKDKDALFAPRPFTTEEGWGIEFEIPASFIQLYFPTFDMSEMRGNFYKCGDQTQVPHYLAWSDLTSENPDYHRYGDFGYLLFE